MWNRTKGATILWVLLGAVLCLVGCGAPDEPPSEPVATSASEIGTGTADSSDSFPYAVAIADSAAPVPGAVGVRCSGVLVTPVWVATSNHCFQGNTEKDDFAVVISNGLNGFTPDRVFLHTYAKSGAVKTYFDPAYVLTHVDINCVAWVCSAKQSGRAPG